MLEMLNPTGGDLLRFAANAIKVRSQLNRAMKESPAKARALAVATFCTPPASARRTPDLARLRADTRRFFGWTASQWSAFEAPLQALIRNAKTSTVMHTGLKVQCYCWSPAHAPARPRDRMLLCHD